MYKTLLLVIFKVSAENIGRYEYRKNVRLQVMYSCTLPSHIDSLALI